MLNTQWWQNSHWKSYIISFYTILAICFAKTKSSFSTRFDFSITGIRLLLTTFSYWGFTFRFEVGHLNALSDSSSHCFLEQPWQWSPTGMYWRDICYQLVIISNDVFIRLRCDSSICDRFLYGRVSMDRSNIPWMNSKKWCRNIQSSISETL